MRPQRHDRIRGVSWAHASACLAIALAVGCEEAVERVPLEGEVTYAGEPVGDGRLSLVSEAGAGEVFSTSIVAGRYAFPVDGGIPPGPYRVEIEGFKKTGRTIPDLASPVTAGQSPPSIDEKVPYIPGRFNSESTTRVTIDLDSRKLDFHLDR